MFKNVPLEIIRGAKIGLEIANVALTDGDAADINEPNEVVVKATKTTVPQQIRNRIASSYKS